MARDNRKSKANRDEPRRVSLEVRIDRVVPGGDGFARLADGRSLFVEGGFPGDLLEVAILEEKKSHARARRLSVIEAGESRRSPPCTVHERCGGCDFMELDVLAQRRLKREMLREALRRTGKFGAEVLGLVSAVRGAEEFSYRSRIRLMHRDGRVGFFASGTHELVEPEECLVASRGIRDLLLELRGVLGKFRLDELRSIDAFELRVLPREAGGEERSLALLARKGEVVPRELGARFAEALGVPVASPGSDLLLERFELAASRYTLVVVSGFSQVNLAINRLLVERVEEFAREIEAKDFADLYSGSGNLSLGLASSGRPGLLVEYAEKAIEAARRAADEQGIDGLEFVASDVEKHAERLAETRTFDLVIADPPRAGVREAAKAIAKLARKGICMVSCDPVTLARDLRTLVDSGFEITAIEPYDMFPNTHHIETLVTLVPARR